MTFAQPGEQPRARKKTRPTRSLPTAYTHPVFSKNGILSSAWSGDTTRSIAWNSGGGDFFFGSTSGDCRWLAVVDTRRSQGEAPAPPKDAAGLRPRRSAVTPRRPATRRDADMAAECWCCRAVCRLAWLSGRPGRGDHNLLPFTHFSVRRSGPTRHWVVRVLNKPAETPPWSLAVGGWGGLAVQWQQGWADAGGRVLGLHHRSRQQCADDVECGWPGFGRAVQDLTLCK